MDINTFDRDAFVKERDEAFLSLDKAKILRYMKKYSIPYSNNELVFWASIHKGILYLRSATEAQRLRSVEWLVSHGFKPYLDFVDTKHTYI